MINRTSLYTVLSVAALAFLPMGCATQDTVQPKEGWYKHLIGFAEVKPHADLPKDDNAAMLIDSRPTAARYDPGHIPLAINIPETQFEKHIAKLPANKAAPIIFYCQGFECDLSHKSAFKAEALGYTNVKVYPAGLPEWEAKGQLVAVSLAHIKKLMEDKTYFVLIDSRPVKVFEQGTIPGSLNIPDSQFDKLYGRLPADKEVKLIFYCGGLKCPLSSASAEKAKALGYKNVFVFPEGYPAWQAAMPAPAVASAPAPVSTPAPAKAASATPSVVKTASGIVIEPGKEKGSISLQSFQRILTAPAGDVLLVDVRDAKEFKKGAFPGAINIPINELEKKMGTLPADKPIIFTCASGARSSEAHDVYTTLGSGSNAFYLDAEVSCSAGKCAVKK